MNLLKDLFILLLTCIEKLAALEAFNFRAVLIIGFLLGIACWVACSYYSRLWNLRYRITITHHILCGIAAILTFVFTLVFSGLQYTKEAASVLIDVWQKFEIKLDDSWKQQTFEKAYNKVKALGIEDFSKYPPPTQGGRVIPTTKNESYNAVATIYANEAVQHFKEAHSYLSKILWAESDIPAQVIHGDIERFFKANRGGTYSTEEAVILAANLIKQGLDLQVPRVVTISQIITVILFFFVQSVPFGLIGYSAYKDLKIIT
jgi:hypothetical protein